MKMLDENGIISEEIMSIIENTHDLMFVKNRDFVYIAASNSFALNCARCNSVDDVIGKTDFELFEDSEIAAKYRADDEKLFASGKSMAEFQEEYPDESGKKHLCLTAKYVLHDKKGEPVAIFGQYHNIGAQVEEEIERRRDINKNVANALSESFFAANYADLITHKFVTIRAMEYTRKMVEHCVTIEQAFEAFIQTLVKSEYQNKMREFCDSTTIAKRLRGKKQIDCEYLSNVASGWCKATFFPCEWDEKGEVTHTLFAVAPLDENIAQEIEEGISNKKNLEAIFDVAPVGIVLYEWNGKNLKVLNMNQYYKDLYRYRMLNNYDEPDYKRIHPDDIADYQKAIAKALDETHHLEYAFRVWNQTENRYGWTQINAIAKQNEAGRTLIYAVYSDITEQKDLEQQLGKSHASLVSALGASNQLGYEYDPVAHTGDCLTEENFFDLPKHIENYPESLRDMDLFHEEDIDTFISTAHEIDTGKKQAHCDARIKKNGEYRWYACTFYAYFDREKERNVALLSVLDITFRMEMLEAYKERLHSLETANEDALIICDVNLTKNLFSNFKVKTRGVSSKGESGNWDALIAQASESIPDPEEERKYRSLFQREALLERFEQGESHIKFEHFYRQDSTYTDMVETVVDLMTDLINGDVVGVFYARDLNVSKMSGMMLRSALDRDYPMAALVYTDTDEYFLYEVDGDEYCSHKQNYWKAVFERLANSVDGQELADIRNHLTKEKVLSYLEQSEEASYAFYGYYRGMRCRLEAKFRYVDKKHHLLIASLRNITDEELYKQYKYASEHDPLTGLYNRATVFQKSRELIEAYPEEQFVILHCDIQHFHLYNTFFGEEGGNELLCRMADVFREMAKAYDHLAYGRIESDVFCICFPVDRVLFEKQVRVSFDVLGTFSPNFPLRLAIGAYWITDTSMSLEAMFTRATIAAKSDKKNLFGLISRYDESMEQNLQDTHQITSEMTAAIEQEQFEVYLQPKYSLQSEKMVGAEALVRWKHPKHGMISPGKFIPVFEQNGFIANLDRYMWEHVCQILRGWIDEGKPMYPVSVNISRVSMYNHATVSFLKELIKKYQFDPKYLELELTESAYMDDPEDLKRMLRELQDYGFHILIDDFGSGYSSLNTLRELPVDILKLDMKFLSETQNDPRANAVLSSVVRMSKLLRLPIVAEGVEKREQADYLRDMGCEYVQGYLFAKPMPVGEYEQLLEQCIVSEQTHETSVIQMINEIDFDRKTTEILSNRVKELEKQNEELKRRMSFLEAAIDNVPNPIFMKGSDGRFVFFNQSYAECFNMCKENYIGGTVLDLDYLPEEDRRKYQAEDLHLIKTGEVSSYDKNFVFNDGKVHPSFYWSKGFICPDTGEHGLIGEIVDISGERKVSDNLAEIVRGTARLFERFFVVDLENAVYSKVDKDEGGQNDIMISSPSAEFFRKTVGRFYNPINMQLLDDCFTVEGLREMLKDKDDHYLECKDKLQQEHIFGTTIYCIERREGIPMKVIYAIRDITETYREKGSGCYAE